MRTRQGRADVSARAWSGQPTPPGPRPRVGTGGGPCAPPGGPGLATPAPARPSPAPRPPGSRPARPDPRRPPAPRRSLRPSAVSEGRGKEDAGRRPRRRFARSGKGQSSTSALSCAAPPPEPPRWPPGRSREPPTISASGAGCSGRWRGGPLGGRDVRCGNAPCCACVIASTGSGPAELHSRDCYRPRTGPRANGGELCGC